MSVCLFPYLSTTSLLWTVCPCFSLTNGLTITLLKLPVWVNIELLDVLSEVNSHIKKIIFTKNMYVMLDSENNLWLWDSIPFPDRDALYDSEYISWEEGED